MSLEPTVIPPSGAILEVAYRLEQGVRRFLRARDTLPKLGKYESHLEALNLFYVVIRHIDAIYTLAKRDLVLLPSAFVLGRAAFESTIKVLWMLKPNKVFEREARWLAHLSSEEKYYFKLADLLDEGGIESAAIRSAAPSGACSKTASPNSPRKILPPQSPATTGASPTVVTLAHELAHAYTHVGRDIDGE